METLLSLSFDNISSKDNVKIRKGLRQIEGLLAQICLSQSRAGAHQRRASVVPSTSNHLNSNPKTLQDLPSDPAFREFFRLQDGFEWNVATRLTTALERLLGLTPLTADPLIAQTLTLLQGTLLLHPPSRSLFSREIHMNLLLDLLDTATPPALQSAALLVLVTALLGQPRNVRLFERIDGLLTITSLFRARETTRGVKVGIMEFLYFYLMPETPLPSPSSTLGAAEQVTAVRVKRSRSLLSATTMGDGGAGAGSADADPDVSETASDSLSFMQATRSTDEKQRLLGKYLSNVQDLVQDLRESAPFGV